MEDQDIRRVLDERDVNPWLFVPGVILLFGLVWAAC